MKRTIKIHQKYLRNMHSCSQKTPPRSWHKKPDIYIAPKARHLNAAVKRRSPPKVRCQTPAGRHQTRRPKNVTASLWWNTPRAKIPAPKTENLPPKASRQKPPWKPHHQKKNATENPLPKTKLKKSSPLSHLNISFLSWEDNLNTPSLKNQCLENR